MQLSVDQWTDFFDVKVRRNRKLIEAYKRYLNRMSNIGIVPIFESSHLRQMLGISPFEFYLFTAKTDQCYRTFTIPKKSGGVRQIHVPWSGLLHSQRWIGQYILRPLPVSDYCHGFRPERSIITNAEIHIGNQFVLSLDIKDFFDSIALDDVRFLFERLGYPPGVCFSLSRMCTRDGCLPQGAASSPFLSNQIFQRLDIAIGKICEKSNARYSRYADDITISSDVDPTSLVPEIEETLLNHGYVLNHSKTRLMTGDTRKVTGISINTGRPRVPKSKRRQIRLEAFNLQKDLVQGDMHWIEAEPLRIERVVGRLAFWMHVEPENDTAKGFFEAIRTLTSDSISLRENAGAED